MIIPKAVSSYLVKPTAHPLRRPNWRGFRTRFFSVRRTNPHLATRMMAALAIWGAFFGSINYLSHPSIPGQASFVDALGLTSPTTALASSTPVTALPSGPSGQLLPPGTLAPDRTYANNYARGQCTWYVAGRRPIPAGWGNAANWYYRAKAAGWKVGTTPAVAAVAWTPSGYYGHVALVENISSDGRQVYISEMNYRGLYVKSYRWAPAGSFKYIY